VDTFLDIFWVFITSLAKACREGIIRVLSNLINENMPKESYQPNKEEVKKAEDTMIPSQIEASAAQEAIKKEFGEHVQRWRESRDGEKGEMRIDARIDGIDVILIHKDGGGNHFSGAVSLKGTMQPISSEDALALYSKYRRYGGYKRYAGAMEAISESELDKMPREEDIKGVVNGLLGK